MNPTIVQRAWPDAPVAADREVPVRVDRATLTKRRCRVTAEDGHEFGFDLEAPLQNGSAIYGKKGIRYVIAQQPEPVLEIDLGEVEVAEAARRGWLLGNLHFPVEVADRVLRVADDPALRPLLERERVPFTAAVRVFTPLSSHTHHHGH